MGDSIGKVIKETRTKKGYTDQADFASLVGISGSSLSLIENDKQYPRKETLQKIADALDLPPGVLEALSLDLESGPAALADPETRDEIAKSYRALRVLLKDKYGLI